ncbi:MAG: DNA polymerase I [Planctomycetales bacterium]|nr:DNA polymerase I [Planctomycetales bacterium]
MASKTLLLVDGHAQAYQAFHALGGLQSPDGRPTGAVYGFARVLQKVVRERTPDYAAVVFDPPGPTFRHEQFADYKAGRAPMPEDLVSQIPLLRDLVEALGIAAVEVAGFEADDVIAELARRALEAGDEIEVLVLGKDKDLGQILGPRVRLLDPSGGDVRGTEWLLAERGLEPRQIPDWLGLAGDASDGIPGVPGIGDKTAVKLLRQFGSIEAILSRLPEVEPPRIRETLRAHADEARRWRDLATLARGFPCPHGIAELRLRPPDDARLRDLYARLGFRTLVAETAEREPDRSRYRVTGSAEELRALVADLRRRPEVAVDTETTSADPVSAVLVGVSLCGSPGEAVYVPVRAPERSRCLPEEEAAAAVRDLFAPGGPKAVGHNVKYDFTVLGRVGVPPLPIGFDTMIAAYLLNPGRVGLSLEALAAERLGEKKIPRESLIGSGKSETTMDRLPLDRVAAYAAEDADCTFRILPGLRREIEERGLGELLRTVELPLVPVLAAMERRGIALDPAALDAVAAEVRGSLAALEKRIEAEAAEPVNLRSPKQLAALLFGKLKLPVVKKTKTGPSTDADVLEELTPLHPLPALLLEHRTLAKLLSTYLEVLPKLRNPVTGRIHSSFSQTVAATGRLSSSDPNLQNLPVRTELGRRIRAAFTAGAPDQVLLSADYSQVELRMLAHLAEDEALAAEFRAGRDIHRAVAADIFGVRPEAVQPEQRRVAKAVNFGIVYGQTPFGLSRELSIPKEDAERFIAALFGRYAGVKRFIEKVTAEARASGEVRTILGRRRSLPEIHAANRDRRQAAERMAVNTVVQGSAADLIKVAMLRVEEQLAARRLSAGLLIQIHDELLLECPRAEVEATKDAVVAAMAGALPLRVPLVVDTSVGRTWGDLK